MGPLVYSFSIQSLPWRDQFMRNLQLVQDPCNYKIDYPFDRNRFVIEPRHGGKDYSACFRSPQHVRQMNAVEGGFPLGPESGCVFL